MISLKTILIEGRYDSLVTKLSAECIRVIKDSYSAVTDPRGYFAGSKIYYDANETGLDINNDQYPHILFHEVENVNIPLEFYFTLKVKWNDAIDGFNYGGDAYNETSKNAADPPLIEIRIEMNSAEYPKALSEVSMVLRDVIRHEIEHLTQSGWNMKPNKYLPSDMASREKIQTGKKRAFNYFLLKKEIPAMILGMYLKAKKMKQPFKQVVHNYLQYYVDENHITSNEYQKIINTWKTYLPKLGIRQEL
jgi:hypothetical protein